MECDEHGNVWVTGPGGVWVLTPEGRKLGVVETPEICGSICWGAGPEAHTLFLTTTTTAHMLPTLVGSAPLPPF
jgi:gluconolactonase